MLKLSLLLLLVLGLALLNQEAAGYDVRSGYTYRQTYNYPSRSYGRVSYGSGRPSYTSSASLGGGSSYGSRQTYRQEKPSYRVTFRGAQSYPGYQGRRTYQPQSPRKSLPDLGGAKIYGRRKDDRTYQEGLSELADLMNA